MKKQFLIAPLALAVAGFGLIGCGEDNNNASDPAPLVVVETGPSATTLTFTAVNAPSTVIEKREILTATAKADGVTLENFGYKTLLRSDDVVDRVAFGQLVDEAGNALYSEDGSPRISNSNEYTSILQIDGKLFSVSQMEDRPGAMFLMELNQDIKSGELSVKSMSQLDQSGIDGGWVHCAGSVTPWQTHLASEEYEPNARELITATEAAADGYTAPMLQYFQNAAAKWNPYSYGFNIEVKVDKNGTATMAKHYAMGRLAFELAKVMPDQKTVFMTDDGTNVGLYMFVADKAGDLSAGTTYAAKWTQTNATAGGAADLSWVNLGHATDSEVSAYIHGANPLKFTDIFETATPAVDHTCAAGFSSVNAGGVGQECLKIKTGMEKAASRLETRRYAGIKGATTEFRKEEGLTYDAKRHSLYIGMSEIAKGMETGGSSNYGLSDDIKLTKNACGAVYKVTLATDTSIGSDYVPNHMAALINGRPVTESDPQVDGFDVSVNSCHINGIANPDNVTYMSGYDYLIIGEDTGSGHQNDVIWAYNFANSELIRLQTTPYGAETTSPYWYENINGWAYLTSVVQHPYGESDEDKNTGAGETRAYTGYVGPFPSPAVKK